jgi:hypothetical protein
MPCPNKLGPILTNIVTGCHPLALKVTRGPIPFGGLTRTKITIPDNFLRGKTDNKSEAITLARIIGETDSSNEAALSQVVVSERRFTLPEIAKAARRWLAPEPLEKLLHELKGEEESEAACAPARATDRERNRAYERLRSLGKLDQ